MIGERRWRSIQEGEKKLQHAFYLQLKVGLPARVLVETPKGIVYIHVCADDKK